MSPFVLFTVSPKAAQKFDRAARQARLKVLLSGSRVTLQRGEDPAPFKAFFEQWSATHSGAATYYDS